MYFGNSRNYFKFVEESRAFEKRSPTLRQEAWEASDPQKPETPPAESALRIAPVCKKPPAARARGPRDRDKTPRGEPGFGVL